MTVFRKSDEMYQLESRIQAETNWRFTVIDDYPAFEGVPLIVTVIGFEILTGRGPVLLTTGEDLDNEIARAV